MLGRWAGKRSGQLIRDGTLNRFTARYDGSGLRVNKWDAWLGNHDYSFGPGGLLHDSNNNTIYTPGFALKVGLTPRFSHGDWQGSSRYLSDTSGNF